MTALYLGLGVLAYLGIGVMIVRFSEYGDECVNEKEAGIAVLFWPIVSWFVIFGVLGRLARGRRR